MKKMVVVVCVAMLSFTMTVQADDALVEQVVLLRMVEEAGLDAYDMVEVLEGYKQYREMMDDLVSERDEACAAVKEALEAGTDVADLTRDLMDIDMEILEKQQAVVSEAGSVLGAEAVAELYLVLTNMDDVKAELVAELTGKPAVSCCGTCPAAIPQLTDEQQIEALVKEGLEAIAAQDIDTMMKNFSDDFSNWQFQDKESLREFIEDAKASGYLDGLEVDLSERETTITGDTAEGGPAVLEGSFGSISLWFEGAKENGVWKITDMDIVM